jgi:hypothetical protein
MWLLIELQAPVSATHIMAMIHVIDWRTLLRKHQAEVVRVSRDVVTGSV